MSLPSFSLRSPSHIRVRTLKREGGLQRGQGTGQHLSLPALPNLDWLRPKLNPSPDKAEAFKQPKYTLNQLQCPLQILPDVHTKEVVYFRVLYCLVLQVGRHPEQAGEHWSGTMA